MRWRSSTSTTCSRTSTYIQVADFVIRVLDGVTLSNTRAELTERLADDLEAKVGEQFRREEFVAALQPGSSSAALRYSWKYGCSRGITGTPIFLINGVVADGAEGWSLEAW